jgi:hypothetical protein
MLRRLLAALANRKTRGTLLELAGFALLVTSAWEVSRPLGLAAAGLALVLIALVLEGGK